MSTGNGLHVWSKRITALAFIGLILLGNFWLVWMMTGIEVPAWTANGFFIFIVVAAVGGLGLMVARIRNLSSGTE